MAFKIYPVFISIGNYSFKHQPYKMVEHTQAIINIVGNLLSNVPLSLFSGA